MSVDTPIFKDGGAGGAETDLVKNTTTKDFMRDVVEASREVPVLVDFWAPWCGPCRQLTPILEKAVRAAKGAVRLVKLNIDDHPQIPGQMGVQSIPAVFAFQDGRPVDGFMGALPESRVNAFIARLIGDTAGDVAADLEAAEAALAAGDVNNAAQLFGEILQQDRENAQSLAGLAKCYIKTGDLARAEQTLGLVPPAKAETRSRGKRARRAGARAQGAAGGHHRDAARQTRRRSEGRTGPLRSRAGAERQGRSRRRARRAADARRQEPRLERRRGAQAAGAIVRCLGGQRSRHHVGPAKVVVAALRLRPRSASLGLDRPLSQHRRHAERAAAVSAARGHSAAARLAHAQCVRAALSRPGRSRALGRSPHRRGAAGA